MLLSVCNAPGSHFTIDHSFPLPFQISGLWLQACAQHQAWVFLWPSPLRAVVLALHGCTCQPCSRISALNSTCIRPCVHCCRLLSPFTSCHIWTGDAAALRLTHEATVWSPTSAHNTLAPLSPGQQNNDAPSGAKHHSLNFSQRDIPWTWLMSSSTS